MKWSIGMCLSGTLVWLVPGLSFAQELPQNPSFSVNQVSSQVLNDPYIAQRDYWHQPTTDPWLMTTTDWQIAEWRLGSALDLGAMFGENEEYLNNQSY